MNKKLLSIFLILIVAMLLFGCTGGNKSTDTNKPVSSTVDNSTNNNNNTPAEKISVKPVIVEGKIGDSLSDNSVKIKVNSYELRYLNTYQGEYLVMDINIENLSDRDIDIYNNFRLLTSLTDSYGSLCYADAVEKSDQVLPQTLKAGEKKSGLLLCGVDGSYGADFSNVSLFFNDKVPYELMDKYTSDSKFGEIKVALFKFADIQNKLTASGKIGEWVDDSLGWNAVRVNSWKTVSSLGTVDSSVLTGSNSACWRQAFHSLGSTPLFTTDAYAECDLLVVNLTIKNKKGLFDENDSPSVSKYELILNNVDLSSKNQFGEDVRVADVYTRAYEQLSTPLDLKNIAPGEERTGDIVFVVPKLDNLRKYYGASVTDTFTINYSSLGITLSSLFKN